MNYASQNCITCWSYLPFGWVAWLVLKKVWAVLIWLFDIDTIYDMLYSCIVLFFLFIWIPEETSFVWLFWTLQFLSACCTARRKGHFSFWVCYKDSIPYGRCWAYQVLGLLYFPLCPQNPVNYCLKWKKSFVLQIGTWNNPFM